MVPRTDVVVLRMSVDEALKYVISMGVVAPPAPPPAPQPPALAVLPAMAPPVSVQQAEAARN